MENVKGATNFTIIMLQTDMVINVQHKKLIGQKRIDPL